MHSKIATDVIICIGNGGNEANQLTNAIANDKKIPYYGFLNAQTAINNGCYHTSIYDITAQQLIDSVTGIKNLKIIMLDQDESYYNNSNEFYSTIDLGQAFVGLADVEFINISWTNPFRQIVNNNKSFCILPFINERLSRNKNDRTHCCWQKTFLEPYTDFYTNSDSINMRQKMVNGDKIDLCQVCYNLEEYGGMSPRQTTTIDWTYKLKYKSIQEVIDNTKLLNYEIQVGNKCNLMCRMCDPHSSNLIANEYFKIGLAQTNLKTISSNDFDLIDIDTVRQVQVAGGEPSISKDFYDFLKRCIQANKTDLEIFISTNAVSITKEFISLIKHFSNIKISISIDAVGDINKYLRWPNNWQKFTKNIEKLKSALPSYNYYFNTVVSIYNISQLYHVFEYLETNFPTSNYSMNILENPTIQQPWNFPDKALALANLTKIKNLQTYKKNQIFKSKIDGIINRMEKSCFDPELLAQFFEFNDKLDKSRHVKLVDYIPELDACRKYLVD